MKPIIVSGIQPTGNLHLGNYLGAVKNWVDLQNSGKYEMFITIVDLHALTGDKKPAEIREQITRTAAELIAAGVDPEKTTFFVQSHVYGTTELAWILNTLTPMGELERMTQYKDKAAQFKIASVGLFAYPVLMAADILLFKGEVVPVGQDQIQHVELTRDASRWFNNKYGNFFPEVKHLLTKSPKVMSLLEPDKKMSKSKGIGHVIELCEEPESIEVKIKKAVTASSGGGQAPGVANLFSFLQEFGDKKVYNELMIAEKNSTIRYGDLKTAVSNAISEYFAEFRTKRTNLLAHHDEIADIFIAGAKKAQVVADQTMTEVRKLVGIR